MGSRPGSEERGGKGKLRCGLDMVKKHWKGGTKLEGGRFRSSRDTEIYTQLMEDSWQ